MKRQEFRPVQGATVEHFAPGEEPDVTVPGDFILTHGDVIDPTVAGNFAIGIIGSKYPGPIIHSHQDLKFFAPVRVGDVLTGTGTLSLKEMRRDKAYVAVDCDFKRGDELVWWARMTCIWPEVHLRGEV